MSRNETSFSSGAESGSTGAYARRRSIIPGPVDANVFDPGAVPGTGLARDWPTLARLVTDPSLEGVSGTYFEIDERARFSEEFYDQENARELWETSAALVGLQPVETPMRATTTAPGDY